MSKIISSCSKSHMIKFGALLFVIMGLSSCATTDIIDQSLREFTYQADVGNSWQSPEVTQATLKGDCEDFAFWVRGKLIAQGVYPKEIQVLEGILNGTPHVLIKYKGEYIDTYGRHKSYPEFTATRLWGSDNLDIILAGLSKI